MSTFPNFLNTIYSFCKRNKYGPAVVSPVLFSRNYLLTEELSIKNSCCKYSISRYLNLPIDLNNWSPFPNTQSKSDFSHWPGYLNNVQLSEIRDIYEHWIPLALVVSGLNYLDNCVIAHTYCHYVQSNFYFMISCNLLLYGFGFYSGTVFCSLFNFL